MVASRTLAAAGVGTIALVGAAILLMSRRDEPVSAKRDGITVVAGDSVKASPPDRPALATASAAGAAVAAPPPTGDVDDPLLDGMLPPAPEPGQLDATNIRALHDAVRSQPRDPAWAPRTEAALEDRFTTIPYAGGSGNPVSVLCASTVCEVSGTFGEGTSIANVNVGMNQMQGPDFAQSLERQKIGKPVTMIFGGSKAHPHASTYVAYIARPGT